MVGMLGNIDVGDSGDDDNTDDDGNTNGKDVR